PAAGTSVPGSSSKNYDFPTPVSTWAPTVRAALYFAHSTRVLLRTQPIVVPLGTGKHYVVRSERLRGYPAAGQELGCPAVKWRLWVGKTSVNIARGTADPCSTPARPITTKGFIDVG